MREGEWRKNGDDDDEKKGGVEQDDEDDKTVEEGRVPKGLHNPQVVSKEERDEHNRTHILLRAWCEHCVRGRGRNMMHRKPEKVGAGTKVPKVCMDYFFMTEKDRKDRSNPMLVMEDETTKEKYARAVGQKGVGTEGEMDWLVKDIASELKVWGHAGGEGGSLILKSDSENAIVAVRTAVAKFHGGRVIPEAPAKGESPSNGIIEEAGKTVREYGRVLTDQLENKAKIKVEGQDAITMWMIRWAAMMTSSFAVW